MTFWTLIRRSLRFHVRSHMGVVLGAAIGSAALIGALVVGDSVRESLRGRALQRLDNACFALAPADRVFTTDIMGRAASASSALFPRQTATLLSMPGTASRPGGDGRAN